jgi:putative addiction module component (TIGR02574 family)
MNKALLKELVEELSPEERIQLAQELWDSVSENRPLLTESELDEIERELAEHRSDPRDSLPWNDVRAWLRSRRK